MLIGLISDTHVPDVIKAIPAEVLEAFNGVDLILHAGDIYITSVLDQLQTVAPVLSARGDDDFNIWDERVQQSHKLNVEGLNIFLTHSSDYSPHHVIQYPERHGFEKAPDVIVYGHSHSYNIDTMKGTLLVNPGSATFPQYQHRLGTVAILDITAGKAEARLIYLDGKFRV